jgi:hypothetical protein
VRPGDGSPDGTRPSLPAGSFAFGPKGVPHTFVAEGPHHGRALIGFQPFLFEGSCGRSANERPSACCRRRSTPHRTWPGCFRSASATAS